MSSVSAFKTANFWPAGCALQRTAAWHICRNATITSLARWHHFDGLFCIEAVLRAVAAGKDINPAVRQAWAAATTRDCRDSSMAHSVLDRLQQEEATDCAGSSQLKPSMEVFAMQTCNRMSVSRNDRIGHAEFCWSRS